MKRKLLAICIGLMIALSAGCGKAEEKTVSSQENTEHTAEADAEQEEEKQRPIFYTKAMEATENDGNLKIKDYYITNKVTGLNRYYIDENAVLWGEGRNENGQLGNGETAELGTNMQSPVRIAENVVSVDCSYNGYFCIYLTETGELYGMGANLCGLLGEEYDRTTVHLLEDNAKVTTPVLLMENVAYARAGRECIVALQKDGSVWWWGQYNSVYLTNIGDVEDAWKTIEDENNPKKMLFTSPHKILEDCVYVTTGEWTGAAIGKNGDLYTWGLNVFGECGVPLGEDDYVRTPQKVLENVRMVWPDEIIFNSVETEIPEIKDYSTSYIMNLFVQLENGDILAAGQNLGDKEKKIELTGDLDKESVHSYSDTFVPIEVADVTERLENTVEEVEIGMSMEEVTALFTNRQIQISPGYIPDENGDRPQNANVLYVAEAKYAFLFDETGKLTEISVNE